MLGRKCTDDGNKFEDIAIEDMHLSDALQAELEPCREALLEAVAETVKNSWIAILRAKNSP